MEQKQTSKTKKTLLSAIIVTFITKPSTELWNTFGIINDYVKIHQLYIVKIHQLLSKEEQKEERGRIPLVFVLINLFH